MRFLVATKETQGKRKNDFSFTTEGEMLSFGFECDGESIDGSCGCRRSMGGMETHKATTTMKVVETNMSKQQLLDAYSKSMKVAGWTDLPEEFIEQDVAEIIKIAEFFPEGTILEKRGNSFKERQREPVKLQK